MRNSTRNRRRLALSAGYGTCVRDLRSLAAAMGLPPMEFRAREISRTLLADLPLDQSDRSVECRFYIHFCSVEQVGVVGPSALARCRGPHRGRLDCGSSPRFPRRLHPRLGLDVRENGGGRVPLELLLQISLHRHQGRPRCRCRGHRGQRPESFWRISVGTQARRHVLRESPRYGRLLRQRLVRGGPGRRGWLGRAIWPSRRPPRYHRGENRELRRRGRPRGRVSRCRDKKKPKYSAILRASVPFPEAAGPSMAMIMVYQLRGCQRPRGLRNARPNSASTR